MTKMHIRVERGGRRTMFRVTCDAPLCGKYREGTFKLKTAFSCAHRHFENWHPAEWLAFANRIRDRQSEALRAKLDAEAKLLEER